MCDTDFQTFWDCYGKKRERSDAERAWQRLTAKDQQAAIRGVTAYHRRCKQRGIETAYPAAYLNQRLWKSGHGSRQVAYRINGSAPHASDPFDDMDLW